MNENKFLFSVVIPAHNRPEFLKRLVTALEAQELPLEKFEVIIILSPDDLSFEWLQAHSSSLNLRFLTPKEDLWQGRNVSFKRNHGAKIAEADWIAFTDDDCVPQPNWLSSAVKHLDNNTVGGIEGYTEIPSDSPRTLTWRGAQRLSRFGGYQTCNMFYRKSDFMAAGGFDSENFPWFLEDTDLAWSILDLEKEIVSEEDSIVVHPIGPRASWRLLHEAKRAGLKIRLFQRHPELYITKGMKTLRRSHYLYLLMESALLLSLLVGDYNIAMGLTLALLGVLTLHMFKLFRGLPFNPTELFEVAWRTLLYAPLASWSLLREKRRSELPWSDFFTITKP